MPMFATKLLSFIACACAILVGTWSLTDYATRPGHTGLVPEDLTVQMAASQWLQDLDFDDKKCVLILFYHPHCPCTKATIRCLERLFTRFADQPNFIAVAYCPSSQDDSWIESSLTKTLRNVDGSEIVVDHDGKSCRCFGAYTSGHIVVYDVTGRLIFSGGITPARAHEGHSRATTDLLNKINGLSKVPHHWPVYGCTIVESENRL